MRGNSISTLGRRAFLQSALSAGAALAAKTDGEWRNKQSGMAYRKLGRTGLMISEVVSGGDPIRTKNFEHMNLALEKGLNYLDMAPAYGRGDCEEAYGKLLGGSAKREKVFLTTKISGFSGVRNRLYKEIFDGLPGEKQAAIQKRSEQMRRERMVDKPGYFIHYYPSQPRQIAPAYLSNAMMGDYRHKVEGSPEFRKFIIGSVEGLPTDVGLQASAGPRVFVARSALPATGLLTFGSLARYHIYLRLPEEVDADGVESANEELLRDTRVSWRTPAEQARSLTRSTDFMADYLGLVGLAALLLGGVGVGSAVNVYVRRKLTSVAVLRCLGATERQVFSTYLLQAVWMGALGSMAGVALGLECARRNALVERPGSIQ